MAGRLLAVDDESLFLDFLKGVLQEERYQVFTAQDESEFWRQLAATDPDVILMDINLPAPSDDGISLLRRLREERHLHTPVILITGNNEVQKAVDGMKGGAYDYHVKPVNAERLKISVAHALDHSQLTRQVDRLRLGYSDVKHYGRIVGGSLPMRQIYSMIENCSSTDATVLITGESGTGKELVAQEIHVRSQRARREMIDLNCSAIPKDLMESQLFGHERGAFTGAESRFIGSCERAQHSTLFLDEVCEMEPDLQVKLLRFLQERTFTRVGGTDKILVDVRILGATNREPLREIQAGRLREDLYYRLNVVPIHLPPLRERPEDIELLADHMLEEIVEQHGKHFKGFSGETLACLVAYDWPGNVRELRNVVERMVVLNDGDEVAREMLPKALQKDGHVLPVKALAAAETDTIIPFEDVERKVISDALRFCSGSVAQAARKLRLSQATIYRKIKSYHLEFLQTGTGPAPAENGFQ